MIFKINKPVVLSILSAILLILAFPQTDWWLLSWIGLVPLLFALDGKSARQSFGLAYLAGLIFFWGTMYWFVHVTWVGAFLMIAALSVYFGLFGLGYFYISRWSLVHRPSQTNDERQTTNDVIKNICIAALWVCLEFLRGHLFSGFDWACLGHSQYKNLWMIQIADITGVYGISFVIVFFNLTLKDMWNSFRRGARPCAFLKCVVCVCLLCLVLGYGWFRLKNVLKSAGDPWRIAIIQANIAQDLKSSETEWPDNFDRHMRLMLEAAAEKPDLIIWPETSLPGYMWETDVFIREIKNVARKLGIPILLGAVTEHHGKYFNSSLLISADGTVAAQYDKIHLVPFGEYVPFRNFIPRTIADWIPVEDFSSGKRLEVFSVPGKKETLKLSTLICFEDTLARLARRFSLEGAQLLVNMTNDGWFKDTKAPFLHLQTAVFRTVENRRALVRAANTGVSCAISPTGKITDCIQDDQGRKTFIEGWKIFTVSPYIGKTFYMRYGDIFAYMCFGILAAGFIMAGRRRAA